MIRHRNVRKAERGQVLILCALFMVVLLLFVGLAVDFGMAYLTRAELGKAVDSEALTAARYSAQGNAKATSLAQSAFTMNYGPKSFGLAVPPTPVYTTDASGNTLITVTGTATTKTFFMGMLPKFVTLSETQTATSMAQRVVMTLVLDRTGSMVNDGGQAALPPAVTDFINYFNNTNDNVAVISFANNVTVDVPMRTGGFQTPVINDVNGMIFQGATWSDGALQQALITENSYVIPAGDLMAKVVVFFTDGNANTVQDVVTCTAGGRGGGAGIVPTGKTGSTWNFGGDDTGAGVWFVTTSDSKVGAPYYPITGNPNGGCFQDNGSTNCCAGGGTFPSHATGNAKEPINWTDVSGPAGDARYRSIVDANNLRAAGITVYAIGLGTATEPVDQGFLCQIANDPCSTTYNAGQPTGLMQWAPNAEALDQAFQTVASVIRLRLVQ